MTRFRVVALAVIGAGSIIASSSLAQSVAGSASAGAGARVSGGFGASGGFRGGFGRGSSGGFGNGIVRDFGAGFRGGYGGGFGDSRGFGYGARTGFGYDFPRRGGRGSDRPWRGRSGWNGDGGGHGDDEGGAYNYGGAYVERLEPGYGDTRDSDFFAPYSGPRVRAGRGRVAYGYDRGYPYDHFDNPGADRRVAQSRTASIASPRCDIVHTWDSNLKQQVPIRVCRQ